MPTNTYKIKYYNRILSIYTRLTTGCMKKQIK